MRTHTFPSPQHLRACDTICILFLRRCGGARQEIKNTARNSHSRRQNDTAWDSRQKRETPTLRKQNRESTLAS